MNKPLVCLALLIILALCNGGCVSGMLANMAIKAPNLDGPPSILKNQEYAALCDQLYAQSWRLPVGPPAAELAVAVIEPGDYQGTYAIRKQQNQYGRIRYVPDLKWTVPAKEPRPYRGTILLLHGYRDCKENVLHWALCLAASGYRCVLVDFRGHGRSSGETISFGAVETHDLSKVIDDLEKRGLTNGPIGVLGISYGASTALLLAAHDSRVGAVVALEPYSRAETALAEFARGFSPKQAAKISDETFAIATRKAAARGRFSWHDADPLAVADKITVPVLLYHGAKDTWLSPKNSEALHDRLGGKKEFTLLEDDNHLLLSMRLVPIHDKVVEWFNDALGTTKKPQAIPGL